MVFVAAVVIVVDLVVVVVVCYFLCRCCTGFMHLSGYAKRVLFTRKFTTTTVTEIGTIVSLGFVMHRLSFMLSLDLALLKKASDKNQRQSEGVRMRDNDRR